MPRTYAKLFVEVWSTDSDFRDLSAGAQRLYFLLCSQEQLTPAGVLPLQTKRWARLAKDTTEPQLKRALTELVDDGKVLVDDETEELLVKAYIYRDGGTKTPNIQTAVERAIANIESEGLRDVAAAQLAKALAEHKRNPKGNP